MKTNNASMKTRATTSPADGGRRPRTAAAWLLPLCLLLLAGCTGGYSFTGASIPPGAKTISVATFPNYASTVNPQLSQKLTDELMQMFSSQTPLSVTTSDGDLQVSGQITGYDTREIGRAHV